MSPQLIETLILFAVRRFASWVGLSAQLSDNDYAQIAGALLFAGNEAWQFWRMHQAKKATA